MIEAKNYLGIHKETPKKEFTGFQLLINREIAKMEKNLELNGAVKWYKERLNNLPEMLVTETPLSGKGGWNAEMSGNEVNKITGAFFDIPGQQVNIIKPDGSTSGWNQPGIIQKESEITLPSPEGDNKLKTSGLIGIIKDQDGNVLLTLGQEPLANTEKKAVIKTPFQTSATKFEALLSGDREKDPALANLFDELSKEQNKDVKSLFKSEKIKIHPQASVDANRISATNITFSMEVTNPNLREKLVSDGNNRWCTPSEVKAFNRCGLINAHTASAYLATL